MSAHRDHNQLHSMYAGRLSEFLRWYKRAGTGRRNIHQFRLCIKRLRAFYRFVEFMLPHVPEIKGYARHFKKLFAAAGMIRESQVNRQMLEAQGLPKKQAHAYSHFLNQEKSRGERKLKKALRQLDAHGLEQSKPVMARALAGTSELQLAAHFHEFVAQQAKEIRALLGTGKGRQRFHEMRKRIKAAEALMAMAYDLRHRDDLRKRLKAIKASEKKIGKWHDVVVLEESLKLFIKEQKQKHIPEIVLLKEHLKKKERKLRKAVKRNVADTLGILEQPALLIGSV